MLIKDILAVILLILGILTYATSVLGVYRFRYVLNRMHAAGMADSLGILLMASAGALLYWQVFPAIKLIFLVAVCWAVSPVSSHLIARVEMLTNRHLTDQLTDQSEKEG